MAKYKLEYLWLDGYQPVPKLVERPRSRSRQFPHSWINFRCGVLTAARPSRPREKAPTACSSPSPSIPTPPRERRARHVRSVACPTARRRIPSNARATILDDPGAWFGFEQEYFLYKDGAPLGFPAAAAFRRRRANTTPASATRTSADIAREIVDTHLDLCLDAGINHEGINAEVAKGQWEFQIFGKGSKNAADQMWVARYLMMRLCEKYGVDVNWHCKPLGKDVDWNGSGMHTNFSTEHMREVGGKEYFEALMAAFDKYKNEHIAVYGPDNHLRLTGLHETQSIDKFNYGVANRGASVRVPHSFINNGYAATWKTAVRTRRATPTRSPAASCRPSPPCRRHVSAAPTFEGGQQISPARGGRTALRRCLLSAYRRLKGGRRGRLFHCLRPRPARPAIRRSRPSQNL